MYTTQVLNKTKNDKLSGKLNKTPLTATMFKIDN